MDQNVSRLVSRYLWLLAGLPALVVLWPQRGGSETIDFTRDIRPLLSDNCFFCHGPDAAERKADLRLDVEAAAKAPIDGQAPIVSGHPDKSVILQRMISEDPDEQMPPPESGKSLSAEEVDLIKRWISEGAEWSEHWAYVIPGPNNALEEKAGAEWGRNAVDHLILKRLKGEGLEPSPEADPATLVRRLSFDLTGLPPTPDLVRSFREDPSDAAYGALVERLLQSPAFGERMATYWLDLVRYADTVGYHGDQDHSISPYRDYVIDAFNENLPFDQFTREQLAGDLLSGSTIDQKIASGYNRLLQTSHEGGVQKKEYLAIYAADRVRNVSAVWMGATLGCAQCHDHKYDPFSAKDFYAMAAFFADIDEEGHFSKGTNALPTKRPPEIEVLSRRERERLRRLESRIEMAEFFAGGGASAKRKEANDNLKSLVEERDQLRKSARRTMITVAVKPRTTRLLPRGNWLDDSGEIVQPAIPEFMGNLTARGERPDRLDLADWFTDPRAGGYLTGRVFANRFWYLFFGQGLSRNLEDFGGQGEPPSHPELLDHLGRSFVDSGWDVKAMVRLLVSSSTYRQSSLPGGDREIRDPENRLLARQSRYRLPAEMIRDQALFVSGLLVDDYGGGSVKPYQPVDYYRHLNFPKRKYAAHIDRRQWR
ncbi:MAG: PSD1 and planctomycete cytochrome C domain-containing protein, partial [Verrucomicrobiota bacterium]